MDVEKTNLYNILSSLIVNQTLLWKNGKDLFYVDEFPETPSLSGLYIDKNGEIKLWDKESKNYINMSKEVVDTIDENVLDNSIPTAKSVYNLINEKIDSINNNEEIHYIDNISVATPATSGLYIDKKGQTSFWNGYEWENISLEVVNIINAASTSGTVPTTKSVYDYINDITASNKEVFQIASFTNFNAPVGVPGLYIDSYGLIKYWTGLSWISISGGNTGNNTEDSGGTTNTFTYQFEGPLTASSNGAIVTVGIDDSNYLKTGQGYINSTEIQSMIDESITSVESSPIDSSSIEGMIDTYITSHGFQTSNGVQTIVDTTLSNGSYATTSDVESTIQNAGYATTSDVEYTIQNAGYATTSDVETTIQNAGYLTVSEANNAFITSDRLSNYVDTTISNGGYVNSSSTADIARSAIDERLTNENFARINDLEYYLNSNSYATTYYVSESIQNAGHVTSEHMSSTISEMINASNSLLFPDGAGAYITSESLNTILMNSNFVNSNGVESIISNAGYIKSINGYNGSTEGSITLGLNEFPEYHSSIVRTINNINPSDGNINISVEGSTPDTTGNITLMNVVKSINGKTVNEGGGGSLGEITLTVNDFENDAGYVTSDEISGLIKNNLGLSDSGNENMYLNQQGHFVEISNTGDGAGLTKWDTNNAITVEQGVIYTAATNGWLWFEFNGPGAFKVFSGGMTFWYVDSEGVFVARIIPVFAGDTYQITNPSGDSVINSAYFYPCV